MQNCRGISFEIRAVNNLIKRSIEYTQTTALHRFVLKWLFENCSRDLFQRDFEEAFSIRRSTASNILSLMEKNGLIRRESVSSDKRLKKIVLSEKAYSIHRKITEDIRNCEINMVRGIAAEELEQFKKTLLKIKVNLEENNV